MEQRNSNRASSVPTRMKTRYFERKNEQDAKAVKKQKEESKPRKNLFKRRSNVIGINAIIVNPKVSKIKLESDVGNDVVKEEKEDDIPFTGNYANEYKHEKIVVHELDIPVSDNDEILENEEKYTPADNTVSTEVKTLSTVRVETHPESLAEIITLKKQLALRNMKIKELTDKVNSLQDRLASSKEALEKAENELSTIKKFNVQESNKSAQLPDKIDKIASNSAAPEAAQGIKKAYFLNQTNIPPELMAERYKMAFEILINYDGGIGDICWSDKMWILKSFRMVCKTWKRAVENLFEEDRFHLSLCPIHLSLEMFRKDFSPTAIKFVRSGSTIYTQKLVLDNTKGKLSPSYNPCVSRHVLIEIDKRCRRWEKFSDDVLKYLEVFGRHIWNLTIFSSPYNHNYSLDVKQIVRNAVDAVHARIAITEFICKCISLVPNVKSLTVDISVLEKFPKENTKFWEDVISPLKTLNELRTVHFGRNNKLNYKIVKNSHQNITNLYLDMELEWNNEAYFKILELEFPNLSQVTCRIESNERWTKFITVTWSITKLTLSFQRETYKFSNVLESLSQFKNSLKYLVLDFGTVAVNKIDDPIPLKLPLLKYLHIICPRQKPISWNIILDQLKELETFKLDHVLCTLRRGDSSRAGKSFWSYIDDFMPYYQRGFWEWENCSNLKAIYLTVDFRPDGIGRKKIINRKQVWIKGINQKRLRLDYQQVVNLRPLAFGGVMNPRGLKGWSDYNDSDSDKE